MDDTITRIKNYALARDNSLADDGFLTEVVNEIVDRALLYMNRDQFVEDFEEDIDNNVPEEDLVYPIPKRVERVLATVVLSLYRSINNLKSDQLGNVTKIKDHEQEVTFSGAMRKYLDTSGDVEVFGVTALRVLDTYRVAYIPGSNYVLYDDSKRLQKRYK